MADRYPNKAAILSLTREDIIASFGRLKGIVIYNRLNRVRKDAAESEPGSLPSSSSSESTSTTATTSTTETETETEEKEQLTRALQSFALATTSDDIEQRDNLKKNRNNDNNHRHHDPSRVIQSTVRSDGMYVYNFFLSC